VTRRVASASFRAMSVDIRLIGVGVADDAARQAADTAHAFALEWEAAFSRFLPDSELSRLNAARGRPTCVSTRFIDVLERAIAAVHQTDGRFNPAILPALRAAGYDRDIAQVWAGGVQAAPPQPAAAPSSFDEIRIDRQRQDVTLPPGMQLDFGGIAKGIFVDEVAARLAVWPGGCVDAGGDLRTWGLPPSGERWVVGIEDPQDATRTALVVEIVGAEAAAAATSGSNRRHWQAGAATMHHLIEPRTGQPLAGAAQVTAFAASAAAAEVATKALLVAAARGERLDPVQAAAAILFTPEGRIDFIPGTCPDACLAAATLRSA